MKLDSVQIEQLLHSTDGPFGRDIMRRATNVQLAARRQAGVRSGRLRRGIIKRGPARNDKNGLTVEVGAYTVDYARIHHDGTAPHTIVAVNAKVLHFKVGGVDVFVRQVNHPGTAPNRFLTDNLKEALR